MAALAGFGLTIDGTGDVEVGPGMIDEVACAAVVLDVSALAIGDGTHNIVTDGTTTGAQASGVAIAAGEYVLGQFVEDTAAATSVTFEGRGDTVLASS